MYDPPEAPRNGIPRFVVATLAIALSLAAGVMVFVALDMRADRQGTSPVGSAQSLGPLDTIRIVEERVPAGETLDAERPFSPLRTKRPLAYGSGHYTWMTASLPELVEANARVEAFRERGFNSNVAPRVVNGEQYYGVTLGLFPSRASAEGSRPELPPDVQALPDLWLLPLE